MRLPWIGSRVLVAVGFFASNALAGGGSSYYWHAPTELGTQSGNSLSAGPVTVTGTSGGIETTVMSSAISGIGVGSDPIMNPGESVTFTFARSVVDVIIELETTSDDDLDGFMSECQVEAFDEFGNSLGIGSAFASGFRIDTGVNFGRKHFRTLTITPMGDVHVIWGVRANDIWFECGEKLNVPADDATDRSYAAMFPGVPGLQSTFNFPAAASGPSLSVSVYDPAGTQLLTTSLVPPYGKLSIQFTCSSVGTYHLDVTSSTTGTPFTILSRRKLVGEARKLELFVYGDGTGAAMEQDFFAVAGGKIKAEFKGNAAFPGPISVACLDSQDALIDMSTHLKSQSNKKQRFGGLQFDPTGKYTFSVGGFGTGAGEKVSLELKQTASKSIPSTVNMR